MRFLYFCLLSSKLFSSSASATSSTTRNLQHSAKAHVEPSRTCHQASHVCWVTFLAFAVSASKPNRMQYVWHHSDCCRARASSRSSAPETWQFGFWHCRRRFGAIDQDLEHCWAIALHQVAAHFSCFVSCCKPVVQCCHHFTSTCRLLRPHPTQRATGAANK